jgi:hypothetical protein
MPQQGAPRAVTLLIYNRPDHTERVMQQIARARPTHLLIYADGAACEAHRPACEAARERATRVTWPCTVLTNFRSGNVGVRTAVAEGVTWALGQVGESIILEDDCLAAPDFFPYAWELLDHFRHDLRVMHVGGECYHAAAEAYPYSYFFSRYPLPWGWATWQRAWAHYDPSLAGWRDVPDSVLRSSLFDLPEEVLYWYPFLREAIANPGDVTWDYLWMFACWLNAGLAVHPKVNLISNIGWGVDASHTKGTSPLNSRATGSLGAIVHPGSIIRDRAADAATFDDRFPGRELRRMRAWDYRLTLPLRRAKRWLFN